VKYDVLHSCGSDGCYRICEGLLCVFFPGFVILLLCIFHGYLDNNHLVFGVLPILVAERFKAWVCGRSLAGISGSNPDRDMDICPLSVLCVIR
jgi:hypothetical protein